MVNDNGWFRCTDRKEPWCIHPVLKCNNVDDCQNGSDEEDCAGNFSFHCRKCGQRTAPHGKGPGRGTVLVINRPEYVWSFSGKNPARGTALVRDQGGELYG